MSIDEFIEEIARVLRKAGIECPEAEAMQLACHILSCRQSWLYAHKDELMDDKVLLASAALINERTKGRPLQYVIGTANFYGVELAVDERVLIPRPETELLADMAIEWLKAPRDAAGSALCAGCQAASLPAASAECGKDSMCTQQAPPKKKVLDLCTGSGAIAAAVAANVDDVLITATELSPRAFMLARVNLRPYKNVEVRRGDLFEALEKGSVFDAILTNPPYVASSVIETLKTEVKDYEPRMALDGGEDGLDLIRKIIAQAPDYLRSGGLLLMEIGDDQADSVIALAAESGCYAGAEVIKDLAGRARILRAVRL